MTKKCTKCKIEKPLSEYGKRKISKDGYMTECKKCNKERLKEWHVKNKNKTLERKRKYYLNNKENILKSNKNWKNNNKEKVIAARIEWRKNNKEKVLKINRRYEENNREKRRIKNRIYDKNNRECINLRRLRYYYSDLQYNIKAKIRSRILHSLKSQELTKNYRTIDLLGCSFVFYKEYLESLFTDGMTWELLKDGEIHIDHKLPIDSFDLTNIEEQKACFHYSNTQPLWKIDNIIKGNKIII